MQRNGRVNSGDASIYTALRPGRADPAHARRHHFDSGWIGVGGARRDREVASYDKRGFGDGLEPERGLFRDANVGTSLRS
jgi:hypothetical protein